MSDYGEPWVWESFGEIERVETGEYEAGYRVCDRFDDGVMEATGATLSAPYTGYAKRSVACVNALAGIEDPAAFVEAVRRLVETAFLASDKFEEVCGQCMTPGGLIVSIGLAQALADPALAKVRGTETPEETPSRSQSP